MNWKILGILTGSLLLVAIIIVGINAVRGDINLFEYIPPAQEGPAMPEDTVGSLSALENITLEWSPNIQLKASVLGIHFNLNQLAKSADASADDWHFIFAPNVAVNPFDRIFFCGPTESFTVEIRDFETSLILYSGIVAEVPTCN